MKKSLIALIVIGVVAVLLIGTCVSSYNKMVDMSESVDSKLSDIDTQLQRRADLIPNLVSTVKGFTDHEDAVLEKIADARKSLLGANTIEEKAEANEQLTTALRSLTVIVENYPELKSSQNFINLQDELAGTENRIATSRKDYNDAVKEYNSYIKKIPNSIIAGIFNFDEKDYFKAAKGSNEAPEVNFN